MVFLLSRQLRLPKPDNTFPVPTQLQTGSKPTQVVLNIGAATNRLNAAPNVLEEGMFGVFQPVVHPASIAVLFYQASALHQLQVSAGIRLRNLQCVNELADAKAFFESQQAARKTEPQTVAQRVK